jgi:hypothetical protein
MEKKLELTDMLYSKLKMQDIIEKHKDDKSFGNSYFYYVNKFNDDMTILYQSHFKTNNVTKEK